MSETRYVEGKSPEAGKTFTYRPVGFYFNKATIKGGPQRGKRCGALTAALGDGQNVSLLIDTKDLGDVATCLLRMKHQLESEKRPR